MIRRILTWAGNGLLRLAGSEDVPQVKARLEAVLAEERAKLAALDARYRELSGFYWNRIRDDAGWRARLHRKIASLGAEHAMLVAYHRLGCESFQRRSWLWFNDR